MQLILTVNRSLLSLKQLLVRWLEAAIILYSPDVARLTQHPQIFLDQAKGCSQFLYISSIAFYLSKEKKNSALEIAKAIALLLDSQVECYCRQPKPANLLPNFTFKVVPPGWIHIQVTQLGLADWLQHLIIYPPQLENCRAKEDYQLTQTDTYRLFAAQYAHARCCSLLQMAHCEKLITLKELPETSSAVFLFVEPNPIPWLNDQIRYFHPAEHALIVQLLATLDNLYCPRTSRQLKDYQQAALTLSQTFQTFYSCCRIWGEVKIKTLELSQARLGLVMATQISLRLLLQNRLGVPALREL